MPNRERLLELALKGLEAARDLSGQRRHIYPGNTKCNTWLMTYLSEKIMNEIKTPVIVTYKKLNEAVTKALSKDQATIMRAAQTPPAGGWEADEEPPTAKDVAELTEELSKALKVLEEKEEVPGVFVSGVSSPRAQQALERSKLKLVANLKLNLMNMTCWVGRAVS